MAHDDPRERILQAAMDAIAERGMAGLRMADVAERLHFESSSRMAF